MLEILPDFDLPSPLSSLPFSSLPSSLPFSSLPSSLPSSIPSSSYNYILQDFDSSDDYFDIEPQPRKMWIYDRLDSEGQSNIDLRMVAPNDILMVAPNDILRLEPSGPLDSSTDPYMTSYNQNDLSLPMGSDILEYSNSTSNSDNLDSLDVSLIDSFIEGNSSVVNDILEKDNSDAIRSARVYSFAFDHCYTKHNPWSTPNELSTTERYTKHNTWSTPNELSTTPNESSDCSSEVDVVTITDDCRADDCPVVPRYEFPILQYSNKRQRRVPKSRVKNNSVSAKTLSDAMKRNIKRTRITGMQTMKNVRRRINNSLETTPSNSGPSSAQSSRCSSDAEDVGKRANHNSSERKRREVLRTNLQNLRLCVPSLQSNAKAAKVQILNSAKEYVNFLQKDEQGKLLSKTKQSRLLKLLRLKKKQIVRDIERFLRRRT